MIFQEPMTSLNPVFTVGDQIAEAVQLHQNVGRRRRMDRAVEMMQLVGIPVAGERVRDYPHQLSGGMRQRVMIAMALSCNPKLLIADEPTTALDVTVQAQILELMKELRERLGMAILLITHDLGVVAEMVDEVAVMYGGRWSKASRPPELENLANGSLSSEGEKLEVGRLLEAKGISAVRGIDNRASAVKAAIMFAVLMAKDETANEVVIKAARDKLADWIGIAGIEKKRKMQIVTASRIMISPLCRITLAIRAFLLQKCVRLD